MHLPFGINNSQTLGVRGIVATEHISKGVCIESCPLIFVPTSQEEFLKKTVLWNYYFECTKAYHTIVVGYGSLLNHSFTPNVVYALDFRKKTLNFWTLRSVEPGEELFVNYNGYPHIQEMPQELLNTNIPLATKYPGWKQEQDLHTVSLDMPFSIKPLIGYRNDRGLTATTTIQKGEVIEKCPIILFSRTEIDNFKRSGLEKYSYEWSMDRYAFLLGYSGIIPTSSKGNITYKRNYEDDSIYFSAIRTIEAGEDLLCTLTH